MRKLTIIGVLAGASVFALAQTASAERVCRSVCDGGTCVQKCTENTDRVIVHEHAPPPPGPGIDIHAPGVNVDVK